MPALFFSVSVVIGLFSVKSIMYTNLSFTVLDVVQNGWNTSRWGLLRLCWYRRDTISLSWFQGQPILDVRSWRKLDFFFTWKRCQIFLSHFWAFFSVKLINGVFILLQTQTLKHGSSRKCLAISANKDRLLMESCDSNEPRQRWKFGTYNSSNNTP